MKFYNSARGILFTSVCIVLLASALVVSAQNLSLRKSIVADAINNSETLINELGREIRQITENAKELLLDMSILEICRKKDAKAVKELFFDILSNSYDFSNIVLLDVNGEVIASARPMGEGFSMGDNPEFGLALESRSLVVGKINDTIHSMGPSLTMVCPVFGGEGEVVALLGIARRVESCLEHVSAAEFITAGQFRAYDVDGRVLLEFPAGENPAFSGEAEWKAMSGQDSSRGSFPLNVGGRKMSVFYDKIALPDDDEAFLTVAFSLSQTATYDFTDYVFLRDLILLTLAGIIVLAIGRDLWRRSVDSPVQLMAAELEGRGENNSGGAEAFGAASGHLGGLAASVRGMACSVRQRELEAAAKLRRKEDEAETRKHMLENYRLEIKIAAGRLSALARQARAEGKDERVRMRLENISLILADMEKVTPQDSSAGDQSE